MTWSTKWIIEISVIIPLASDMSLVTILNASAVIIKVITWDTS